MANKKTTRKKSTAKKVTDQKQKVSITDIINKKKAKKDKQESKEQELSTQTEGTLPSNVEVESESEITSEDEPIIDEVTTSESGITSEDEPIIDEVTTTESEIASEDEPIIDEVTTTESEIASEDEPIIDELTTTESEIASEDEPIIDEVTTTESEIASEDEPIIDELTTTESEITSEDEPIIDEVTTSESEITSEDEPIITEEVDTEPINWVETTTIESDILIDEVEQDSEDDMDLDDAIQGLYDSDLISVSSEEDQNKQDLLDALDKLEDLGVGNLDDVILDDLDVEDTVNTIDSEQTLTVDEVIHQENNGSQTRLSDLGDEQHITTLSNNRNKVGSRQVIEAKAPEGRQPKRKAPQPGGKPRRHRPVDKEGRPIKRKRPNSNAQGGKKSPQPKKKQTKKPPNVKGLLSKKQSNGNGTVQTINKDGKTMQVRKAVRRKKKPIDKKLSALLASIVVVVSIIVIGINVFGRGVDSVDYQVVNQSETMQQIAQETFGKKYIEDLNARPIAYFETQHNRILAGYLATLEHYLATGEGKNHLEVETVRLYNNLEYIYVKATDKYIKNKQAGDTSDLITNYERNDELMKTVFGGNLKSFAVRIINGYNDIPALRDSLGVSSDAELLLRINTITDEMFSVYYSYVLNNPQPEIEQTLTVPSE